jgi:hypothetical protein
MNSQRQLFIAVLSSAKNHRSTIAEEVDFSNTALMSNNYGLNQRSLGAATIYFLTNVFC